MLLWTAAIDLPDHKVQPAPAGTNALAAIQCLLIKAQKQGRKTRGAACGLVSLQSSLAEL